MQAPLKKAKARSWESSERSALLEQLELQLADIEEDASEAEAAARMAASAAANEKVAVRGFERRKPARRHLASAARPRKP